MKKTVSLICALAMLLSLTFVLTGCSNPFEKKEEKFTLPGVNLEDVTGMLTQQDVINAIGVTEPETRMVTKTTDANGITSYTIRNFDEAKKQKSAYTIRFFKDEASYNAFVESNSKTENGPIILKNMVTLFTVNHENLSDGTPYGTFESLRTEGTILVK
jgi:hypothetical protein